MKEGARTADAAHSSVSGGSAEVEANPSPRAGRGWKAQQHRGGGGRTGRGAAALTGRGRATPQDGPKPQEAQEIPGALRFPQALCPRLRGPDGVYSAQNRGTNGTTLWNVSSANSGHTRAQDPPCATSP